MLVKAFMDAVGIGRFGTGFGKVEVFNGQGKFALIGFTVTAIIFAPIPYRRWFL
jgi:hypothetical protein